ncbi:MAG: methyltransferase domain-containing protein [Nanoarchaeota archaeon]|nr:methyltransferase domain-containing protein [Nanoarchaeota archaeon]
MNNFEDLSQEYQQTTNKPDKKFSILPTMMKLLSPVQNRRVIDLGCGSGFFTYEIAKMDPRIVYGVDNSKSMLKLARKRQNIDYIEADIFHTDFPHCDLINAPFVLNYADSKRNLLEFLTNCSRSIKEGKLVAALDMPLEEKDEYTLERLKRIGAIKKIIGKPKDEAEIRIELWVGRNKCCTLAAKYYSEKTVESLMNKAGFSCVRWHKPIISREGILSLGEAFWKGYENICELSYVVAQK